jgi:aminoglycoside phosphotransferase (APT) family kinase protein
VPTPVLLRSGEQGGWPWLLMTQLHGEPLTAHWPKLDEAAKCSLLQHLGALMAEVHAQPVGAVIYLTRKKVEFLPEFADRQFARDRGARARRDRRTCRLFPPGRSG